MLAFTGGMDVLESQQLLDLVWEILLPAFELDPPAEDPLLQDALAKKLSSLTLAPSPNAGAVSILSQVTGRTYQVETNALNIESLALNFSQSDCSVRFKRPGGEDTFRCGYGQWEYSQIRLFNQPWLTDEPTPVAVSGAWLSADCLTMTIRLIETPFFYTLVYHFIDTELLLEMKINVSLEAPQTLVLTGQRLASPSDI